MIGPPREDGKLADESPDTCISDIFELLTVGPNAPIPLIQSQKIFPVPEWNNIRGVMGRGKNGAKSVILFFCS